MKKIGFLSFGHWSDSPHSQTRSAADVLGDARRRAADRSWDASSRVLSTAPWPDADAVVDGLVAVLAAGASLVQVSNADPAAQERRRTTEKVTASYPA